MGGGSAIEDHVGARSVDRDLFLYSEGDLVALTADFDTFHFPASIVVSVAVIDRFVSIGDEIVHYVAI